MEITSRQYYTLGEMLDTSQGMVWEDVDESQSILLSLSIGVGLPEDIALAVSDPFSRQMFADACHRAWDVEVIFTDEIYDEYGLLISAETFIDKYQKWLQKACAYFRRTLEEHKAILNAYSSKIAVLLDPANSQTISILKSNDMPINETDTEDHLSSLSNTTNDTHDDMGTPIARLEEIQRLYKDEMTRWENDFIEKMTIPG